MLGVIGFVTLAIIIAIFCTVVWYTYRADQQALDRTRSFVLGFSLLAVSCVVWAGAVLATTHTPAFVFLTDALLLLATGFMLRSFVDLNRMPWLTLILSTAGAMILTVRAFIVPSAAYIEEGLLHFSLTQQQALIIGLPFLLVWLPAGAAYFTKALEGAQYASLRQITIFAYCATVLVTCYFLASTRPIVIIATFVSIGVLFVAMTISVQTHSVLQRQPKERTRHGK
jgi:hypothetical protein